MRATLMCFAPRCTLLSPHLSEENLASELLQHAWCEGCMHSVWQHLALPEYACCKSSEASSTVHACRAAQCLFCMCIHAEPCAGFMSLRGFCCCIWSEPCSAHKIQSLCAHAVQCAFGCGLSILRCTVCAFTKLLKAVCHTALTCSTHCMEH